MISLAIHKPKKAALYASVAAENDAFWAGFQKLLAHQLEEIAAMKASFDYTAFAGKSGPLSGPDCVRTH